MSTLTGVARADRKCPRCGSRDLHAVAAGANTNLFCAACTACWHAEGSELTRVNPHRCAKCPEELCRTALHGGTAITGGPGYVSD